MKKFTLILGALVISFIMASCSNKKDEVIKIFNNFFDNEMTALNSVDNADACIEYVKASDARFTDFFTQLDKEFPNDNNGFKGFKTEDNEAAMKVFEDRMGKLQDLMKTKGETYFEPYIAKLEELVYGLAENIEQDVKPADDIADQILAAYENTDKYVDLASDEQYERYNTVDDMVKIIFGLNEDEVVE